MLLQTIYSTSIARIEVVEFDDDAGGDLIDEKKFPGPLPEQIKACLNYLDGLGGNLLRKVAGQAEVDLTLYFEHLFQAAV